MIFEYIETKEIIKSNISYLTPGNAPFYWIIIAAEVFIFKAAHELILNQWYIAFIPSIFILLVCTIQALRQPCETDELTQINQIRMTRVIGVMIPLLALALNISRLKLDYSLFIIAIVITFLQAISFLFLVKDRATVKSQSLNIPQLLVICSSLIFATNATMASLAARHFILDLPDIVFAGYGVNNTKERKTNWTKEDFEKERIARQILDDESPPLLGLYKTAGDAMDGLGIHQVHLINAKKYLHNLETLLTAFLSLWMITLIRTILHVKSLQQ